MKAITYLLLVVACVAYFYPANSYLRESRTEYERAIYLESVSESPVHGNRSAIEDGWNKVVIWSTARSACIFGVIGFALLAVAQKRPQPAASTKLELTGTEKAPTST